MKESAPSNKRKASVLIKISTARKSAEPSDYLSLSIL